MSGSPELKSADSRPTLSVVVIAQDERANIVPCLASAGFADELVVVDALSSDGTADLARAQGAAVYERPWDGFVPQRRHGFERASGEWLLWLDADERVSPELGAEIRALLARPGGPPLDGYRMPRRHHFMGDWLRHGGQYPAHQLRLVRRRRARLLDSLPDDRGIDTHGLLLGDLEGAIDHFSSPTLAARWTKVRRYARLAALDSQGRASLPRLLYEPFRTSGWIYLQAGGWRDGWRGLLWALMAGLEQALLAIHLLRRRRGGTAQ